MVGHCIVQISRAIATAVSCRSHDHDAALLTLSSSCCMFLIFLSLYLTLRCCPGCSCDGITTELGCYTLECVCLQIETVWKSLHDIRMHPIRKQFLAEP